MIDTSFAQFGLVIFAFFMIYGLFLLSSFTVSQFLITRIWKKIVEVEKKKIEALERLEPVICSKKSYHSDYSYRLADYIQLYDYVNTMNYQDIKTEELIRHGRKLIGKLRYFLFMDERLKGNASLKKIVSELESLDLDVTNLSNQFNIKVLFFNKKVESFSKTFNLILVYKMDLISVTRLKPAFKRMLEKC